MKKLSWRALNNQLSMMTEAEVLSLLDLEKGKRTPCISIATLTSALQHTTGIP